MPHTGTRTLAEHYNCGFVHTFHIASLDDSLLILWAGKYKLISPLRNPVDVWTSWVTRAYLNEGDAPLTMFEVEWLNMKRLTMLLDIEFIPIDKGGFPVKGSKKQKSEFIEFYKSYNNIDWEMIYNLPFIKEHYNAPGA